MVGNTDSKCFFHYTIEFIYIKSYINILYVNWCCNSLRCRSFTFYTYFLDIILKHNLLTLVLFNFKKTKIKYKT